METSNRRFKQGWTAGARRFALLVAIALATLVIFVGAVIAAGESWTTDKPDYATMHAQPAADW